MNKKHKSPTKNHLSKKLEELLNDFFLFPMSSSFALSVAFALLVGFKFGETVLGFAFDCLAKTLAWFFMAFISAAAVWLLVLANGTLLVAASTTSCPPFAKASVLTLACKILCFSTCNNRNSGTERWVKNWVWKSQHNEQILNESMRRKKLFQKYASCPFVTTHWFG